MWSVPRAVIAAARRKVRTSTKIRFKLLRIGGLSKSTKSRRPRVAGSRPRRRLNDLGTTWQLSDSARQSMDSTSSKIEACDLT